MQEYKLQAMARSPTIRKYIFTINVTADVIGYSKANAWSKLTKELRKLPIDKEMQFGWFITKCELTRHDTS